MKTKVRLLLAGFLVSFLVVAILAVLSFLRTRALIDRVDRVEHTYIVVSTVNRLSQELAALDKASFRRLITKDSSYLEDFKKSAIAMYLVTDKLRQLCIDNQRQQANIIGLQSEEALYIDDCRRFFSEPEPPIPTLLKSARLQKNRRKMSNVAQQLERILGVENRLLKERMEERQNYIQRTTSLMRALALVFTLLTLSLFVLLFREFRRRIAYQEELQSKITEIALSKRELEHIAYATSHDLQEPLRKIRVLTDKWSGKYKDGLSPERNDIVERVNKAAARMQELVAELMILATLNADSKKHPCSLRPVIDAAMQQLKDLISDKAALLSIADMPEVEGYPDQLKMLFRNLIDNALKFSRLGIPVEINITARIAGSEELSMQNTHTDRKYQCITVADNGIGFDNRHTEKMFGIFRQLHSVNDGKQGKGSGLAICQRIMSNHNGYILAHGFPGEGATFKLYFPI